MEVTTMAVVIIICSTMTDITISKTNTNNSDNNSPKSRS